MKKINQKGFGAIALLVIAAVVAVIAIAGWYALKQSKSNNTGSKSSSELQVTELAQQDQVVLIDVGDEEKLPQVVPDSFKAYMKAKLEANAGVKKDECKTMFSVQKYSSVNISGSTGSVNAKNQGSRKCFVSAAIFWYLKDDNSWDGLELQGAYFCAKLDETNIYSEFIDKCIKSEKDQQLLDNPNGSINNATN